MAPPESAVVRRLIDELGVIPPGVQSRARQGFDVAATLSEDVRQQAFDLFVKVFGGNGPGSFEPQLLANLIPSSSVDRTRLSTAFSLLLGLLTQYPVSTDEFLTHSGNKLFDPKFEPIVRLWCDQIVAQRETLTISIARHRLASEVIASFSSMDVTVDLRVKFDENNKITDSVPVAIMRIETDVEGAPLMMQLTSADIQTLIERLTEISTRMDILERSSTNLLAEATP